MLVLVLIQSFLERLAKGLIIPLVYHLGLLLIVVVTFVIRTVREFLPLVWVLKQMRVWSHWLLSNWLLNNWSRSAWLAVSLRLRVTNKKLIASVVVIKRDRLVIRVILLGLVLGSKRVIVNIGLSLIGGRRGCFWWQWVPWHCSINCLF